MGGTGEQNGEDDWPRVRRETRILLESNYRAGRTVVINQIPRRDDATKTNRPCGQGNPLVKHAYLACIIVDAHTEEGASVRACTHAGSARTRSALASTWRARFSDLAPYPTNCASLSLSLSLPSPLLSLSLSLSLPFLPFSFFSRP